MNSTFGNLESTTEWLEVVFNIIVLTSGLLLVTMLIGNIKVMPTSFLTRILDYQIDELNNNNSNKDLLSEQKR